jgi:hypothetical protein
MAAFTETRDLALQQLDAVMKKVAAPEVTTAARP